MHTSMADMIVNSLAVLNNADESELMPYLSCLEALCSRLKGLSTFRTLVSSSTSLGAVQSTRSISSAVSGHANLLRLADLLPEPPTKLINSLRSNIDEDPRISDLAHSSPIVVMLATRNLAVATLKANRLSPAARKIARGNERKAGIVRQAIYTGRAFLKCDISLSPFLALYGRQTRNMDDYQIEEASRCVGPYKDEYTRWMQAAEPAYQSSVVARMKIAQNPSSHRVAVHSDESLLLELCIHLGGRDLPAAMFHRLQASQQVWQEDGNLIYRKLSDVGVHHSLLDLLSDRHRVRRGLDHLCSTGSLNRSDLDRFEVVHSGCHPIQPASGLDWTLEAARVLAYVSPPRWVVQEVTTYSEGRVLLQQLVPAILHICNTLDTAHIEAEPVEDSFLEMLLAAAAVAGQVDRVELLARAAVCAQRCKTLSIVLLYHYRHSTHHRLDGNLAAADEILAQAQGLTGTMSPRAAAVRGLLNMSQADNLLHKGLTDEALAMGDRWSPGSGTSSLAEMDVLQCKIALYGRIFYHSGRYKEAEQWLKQLLEGASTAHPRPDIIKTYCLLADVYNHIGSSDAHATLDQARSLLTSNTSKSWRRLQTSRAEAFAQNGAVQAGLETAQGLLLVLKDLTHLDATDQMLWIRALIVVARSVHSSQQLQSWAQVLEKAQLWCYSPRTIQLITHLKLAQLYLDAQCITEAESHHKAARGLDRPAHCSVPGLYHIGVLAARDIELATQWESHSLLLGAE